MYPAEFYGLLFEFEDLPDQLIVTDAGEESGAYAKVEPYTIDLLNESFEVYYEGPLLTDPPLQTFISISSVAPNQWTFGTILAFNSFDCLIDEQSSIQDTFEDTYTVTTPFSSGTVSRVSLCLWNGTDANGCRLQLIYGGFGGDPETEPAESALKWSVEFQEYEEATENFPARCATNFGRLKSGFQNSPVGSYDISYSSEGPEFATVT